MNPNFPNEETHIVAWWQPGEWEEPIKLLARRMDVPARKGWCAEIMWRPYEEAVQSPPTLALSKERAAQLMDMLWAAGIRPTENASSAGVVAAKDAHLNDMRKLVQHTLKMRQPF